MATRRFFYVAQEDLVVWLGQHGVFTEVARFDCSEHGFQGFSAYLRGDSQQQSLMLVDVVEEEFSVDAIPKLSIRDRNALIERRLSRKYSRTPYRLGHFQGSGHRKGAEQDVLYSAVSNRELLNPWLEILAAKSTPLVGIFSVPLLAGRLLSKVRKPATNALLLTQHQGNRLRQVYLRNGELKSARLSQAPAITDASYGEYVFHEILGSRRYLERARLLGGMEDVDVYLITDTATAERIIESDKGNIPLNVHFVEPDSAAKAVGLQQVPNADRLEILYLSIAARCRAGHNYALQGETRFHRLNQIRRCVAGAAIAASVTCSVIVGVNLVKGLQLYRATSMLDRQIAQMEETFRREHEHYAPLRADSHEMKLAVDAGDYILANSLPVSWVMQQLGRVLGDYPHIQINELRWQAGAAADGEGGLEGRRHGNETRPISIAPVNTVIAELSGQIVPFDGDMRDAFARIDRLASALRQKTAFEQIRVTEFPLDANPGSSVSGDVVNRDTELSAYFRMSLRLDVTDTESDSAAD